MTTPTTTTVERAEQLWAAAHQCLLDLQGVIVTIIAEKAWEPLGYKTFAEAWKARMSDITLAPEIRPRVVYQLFQDGLTAERVSELVKGVGPVLAEILQREQQAGVPPEKASKGARRPLLEPIESPYATLFIRLSTDTLKRWRALASQRGVKLEDFAFTVISTALEQRQSA